MNMRRSVTLPDHPGLFLMMGYNRRLSPETAQRLGSFDGCRRLTRHFGDSGNLFLYTTYPDVAENEEALVLNLGVARDKTSGVVLSAQELLDKRLATPHRIAHDALTGNVLVFCVSKREPKACLFRSVIGMYGLWYHHVGETFICSTQPRLLIPFLPRAELSADALVSHFLFRTVNGPTTYLKGVHRVEHGHFAKWSGNQFKSQLAQDLRPLSQPSTARVDDAAIGAFRERSERMVTFYTAWLGQQGCALY